MKKKLFIAGIILIVILGGILIFVNKDGNNDDINNNDNNVNDGSNVAANSFEEQNVGNIIFTDITYDYDNGISLLEYTIINKTNKVVNLGDYEIIVKDKKGDVLANIVGFVDEDINPDGELRTGNSIEMDLAEADSIELVLD